MLIYFHVKEIIGMGLFKKTSAAALYLNLTEVRAVDKTNILMAHNRVMLTL